MKQKSFFEPVETQYGVEAVSAGSVPMQFGGKTFDKKKDGARLAGALGRVVEAMSDGDWWTLPAVAAVARCSEAGASARIRDLRKPRFAAAFGVVSVESQRQEDGLWVYRITRKGKQ